MRCADDNSAPADAPGARSAPAGARARRGAALAVLLAVLTVLAYLPALNAEFFWDDEGAIVNAPVLRARDGLRRVWASGETTDYQPVMNSVRWAQWQLWGADARGYHATNLLLHAAAALLLWRCLSALGVPGAWWAAAVFALHPVCVASVAWAVQLKNTLSQFLCLLALLAWLRSDPAGPRRWYAAALAAYAAALLSKGSVVVLPFILLLCAWWRRGAVDRRDLLRATPFFAMALAAGLVTVWFQERNAIAEGGVPDFAASTLAARPGWVVGFYLGKALWPAHLSVVYPRWEIDGGALLSFVPNLLLAAAFVLFWFHRRGWGRPFLFGLGGFTIALFPVMGFFRMYYTHFSLVADPWQYVALPAVVALVCGLAAWGTARLPPVGRRAAVVAGAGLLALLGGLTWSECVYYRSSDALWRKTIRENPRAAVAYMNLGVILANRAAPDDALALMEKAVALAPEVAEFRVTLGDTLLGLARPAEAEGRYAEAAAMTPGGYGRALLGLGRARLMRGDAAGALPPLIEAERLLPRSAQTQLELGLARYQLGDPAAAAGHFRRAVELRPDYADAFVNLGSSLMQLRQAVPAEKALREAVRLNPRSAVGHWKLAEALAAQNKSAEALSEYERALQLTFKTSESRLGDVIAERLRLYREWLSERERSSKTTMP
jgi:tetratricopeptide (TPR) repeat protein